MKCGYCGKEVKNNQNFCTGCGRSIGDNLGQQGGKDQSKSSSFLAVLMLIVLIIIVTAGGAGLIMNGIKGWYVSDSQIVSPTSPEVSDASAVSSREPFAGDAALLGKWQCDDKSAAGYGDSAYGIETRVTLTFDDEGSFSVSYRMINLGITALNETLRGSYSARDGSFTLKPNLSKYKGDYFDNRSIEPTVKYSVDGDKLVITSDSGKELIFKKS